MKLLKVRVGALSVMFTVMVQLVEDAGTYQGCILVLLKSQSYYFFLMLGFGRSCEICPNGQESLGEKYAKEQNPAQMTDTIRAVKSHYVI